jgi:hypothetical protein
MTDVPDFYVDNFAISVGALGVTLTFVHSLPPVEGLSQAGQEIVGRARFSREGAGTLAELLTRALAHAAETEQASQRPDGTTH